MNANFLRIKTAILGQRYNLSVAFVLPKEMRRLNRRYRNKDAATEILSFPLSESSGEIIFCQPEVQKKARLFNRTPRSFLLFLLIHGLLHLKGSRHGSKMEREEHKFQRKFVI